MSSVPNSVAASVSQAVIQQSQTARAADAVRNRDEHHAQRLRQLLEKHIEAVEDSEKVDAHQLLVKENHPEDQQGRKRREAKDEVELTRDADADESKPASDTPTPTDLLYRHLDVEA